MEEISYKKMNKQYRHSYRDNHKINEQYKHCYRGDRNAMQEKTVRGKIHRARYLEVCKMLIKARVGHDEFVWDLGCGNGIFMSRFGDIFNNGIIGLDLSFPSLYHIRQLDDVRLIQGNIENLPVKSRVIRRAIIIETLEHLIDIGGGLREIKRCLIKGGIAIITVPSLLNHRNINFYGNGSYLKGCLGALLAMPRGFKECKWIDDQGKEYPHYEYAKWKLKKIVRAIGFTVSRMGKIPMVFNSKEESLIERIINKMTGNRLGECHILMATR